MFKRIAFRSYRGDVGAAESTQLFGCADYRRREHRWAIWKAYAAGTGLMLSAGVAGTCAIAVYTSESNAVELGIAGMLAASATLLMARFAYETYSKLMRIADAYCVEEREDMDLILSLRNEISRLTMINRQLRIDNKGLSQGNKLLQLLREGEEEAGDESGASPASNVLDPFNGKKWQH